jgi:hypothetical protein
MQNWILDKRIRFYATLIICRQRRIQNAGENQPMEAGLILVGRFSGAVPASATSRPAGWVVGLGMDGFVRGVEGLGEWEAGWCWLVVDARRSVIMG